MISANVCITSLRWTLVSICKTQTSNPMAWFHSCLRSTDESSIRRSTCVTLLLTICAKQASEAASARLIFSLTATGQKGLTTFGGDFDYRQYELSAGAQMFFGFTSTTDLFLRYQRGFGASSNDNAAV